MSARARLRCGRRAADGRPCEMLLTPGLPARSGVADPRLAWSGVPANGGFEGMRVSRRGGGGEAAWNASLRRGEPSLVPAGGARVTDRAPRAVGPSYLHACDAASTGGPPAAVGPSYLRRCMAERPPHSSRGAEVWRDRVRSEHFRDTAAA